MARLYLGSSKISPMFMFKNVKSLNVTPTTSAQTISAPEGGVYSPVNVGAVTSSIDSNIQAENIKKGIKILGVTGSADGASENSTDIIREVKNNVLSVPSFNFTFALPSNAIDIGKYVLGHAFYNCRYLTSVDLSSLTTVSGNYALQFSFYGCYNITSVDLSSLTAVSGIYAFSNAFYGCSKLSSLDLSSLTTISGSGCLDSTFGGCTSLTSVDLSSLTTVSKSNALGDTFYGCSKLSSVDLSSLATISGSALQNAFYGCTSLTSMSFPSLSTINGSGCLYSTFSGCTSLTSLSFPALTSASFGSYTSQFNNMLRGVTGCTVHFPSNLEAVIGSWTSVTAGFGGTNTVVSFDLPATT